jgi:sugar phosphate isomerase/epimerase
MTLVYIREVRREQIHLKDFKRKGYQWTNLLEGDVNFRQVRLALGEIGYDGFLTELPQVT